MVPRTVGGKLFTLVYSLYGIPMFIWYIVKLGAIFKFIVKRVIVLWLNRLNKSLDGFHTEAVQK